MKILLYVLPTMLFIRRYPKGICITINEKQAIKMPEKSEK